MLGGLWGPMFVHLRSRAIIGSSSQVSWVQFLVIAGFFTSLCFRLIISKYERETLHKTQSAGYVGRYSTERNRTVLSHYFMEWNKFKFVCYCMDDCQNVCWNALVTYRAWYCLNSNEKVFWSVALTKYADIFMLWAFMIVAQSLPLCQEPWFSMPASAGKAKKKWHPSLDHALSTCMYNPLPDCHCLHLHRTM